MCIKKMRIKNQFSLIELLLVLGIIIIILSIGLPSFLKMTKGRSVEIAARTLGAKLNAVRSYAITNREYAALVFVTNQTAKNSRYNFRAYRACIVDSNYAFQSWVEDEKWEYLPMGTILLSITNSAGTVNSFNSATQITSPADGSVFATTPAYLYGIVFKSTGDCAGSRKYVVVGEGVYTTGSTPGQHNITNVINITVDNYTGRVSYGTQ